MNQEEDTADKLIISSEIERAKKSTKTKARNNNYWLFHFLTNQYNLDKMPHYLDIWKYNTNPKIKTMEWNELAQKLLLALFVLVWIILAIRIWRKKLAQKRLIIKLAALDEDWTYFIKPARIKNKWLRSDLGIIFLISVRKFTRNIINIIKYQNLRIFIHNLEIDEYIKLEILKAMYDDMISKNIADLAEFFVNGFYNNHQRNPNLVLSLTL